MLYDKMSMELDMNNKNMATWKGRSGGKKHGSSLCNQVLVKVISWSLRLMERIRLTTWYGKYPIIYKDLYLPSGAGLLPSTVSVSVQILSKSGTSRCFSWHFALHLLLFSSQNSTSMLRVGVNLELTKRDLFFDRSKPTTTTTAFKHGKPVKGWHRHPSHPQPSRSLVHARKGV